MGCYCCVKGCKNNRNIKKKDPNSTISFHAFPSNPDLRTKWLKAIGRPNWNAPSHTRICSAHFTYDQINHESCRTRIKDDACPVNCLPLNSNFEASNVEACRICLATDAKMYSLREGVLNMYIQSIVGFNENSNIEGLPQFVCHECAAQLKKCYSLIEKSIIAQATLLDIFAKHGQITKHLIKIQNRKQLNLISSLNIHIPKNIFKFTYDQKDNLSHLLTTDLATDYIDKKGESNLEEHYVNYKEENDFTNDKFHGIPDSIQINEGDLEIKLHKEEVEEIKIPEEETVGSIDCSDDNKYLVNSNVTSPFYDTVSDIDNSQDLILKHGRHNKSIKRNIGNKKRKTVKGMTPDEVHMQKYFNIVKLTLQEQIDEWKKISKRSITSKTVHDCDICSKSFASVNSYHTHLASHNPSRGEVECPVCKLRFKNDILAKSHQKRMHGKKFYCKICSKAFSNVAVAKKHHRLHSGYTYKCHMCPFTTAHESSLGVHVRALHSHDTAYACARCGIACVSARGLNVHWATAHRDQPKTEGDPAYRCERCNVSFLSEGAKRVHILTSCQHKRKPDLCDMIPPDPAYKTTCNKCGTEFPSLSELISHSRTEHRRPARRKTIWRMPGDSYPLHCEHCGVSVNSRREHWWHVKRQHPSEIGSYQPVITAVCHTCGKGFQNTTKLRIHALRHGRPSVRCPHCPRLFYDKYAVARHALVHADTPAHSCPTCGRAFRHRGNLERHARVHSAATPYECKMCGKKFKYSSSVNLHVRTVHYKMPHPPRKKRTRTTNCSVDDNSANNI